MESSEAAPQRNMNLLQQVATLVWVAFIRASKPLQGSAERLGCVGIQLLAIAGLASITHS